jgi:osmoprotectant transport system substrate-binding protein
VGNRRPVAFLVALAFTVSLAACHSSGASGGSAPNALGDNRITVGSFDFAESELLGELYSQALERGGF